jgi:hypothetical protein
MSLAHSGLVEMFTPDSLLDLAVAADEKVRRPDYIEDRWELRRQRDDAFLAALWMENNDRRDARAVGPFGAVQITQGSRVRIRRGAEISGSGERHALCAHTVTVRSVSDGYVGLDVNDRIVVRNQSVVWSGKNGWRTTDAINVTMVP